MHSDQLDEIAVQARLWREIDKAHTGMLGLVGAEPRPFQPMTAFVGPEDHALWFFSHRDSDLADALGQGAARAMFVFQKKDFYACLGGRLHRRHDRERMDRLWSPSVSAWYPAGKDDPGLTLLRLVCEDAQVWTCEAGPARHAWEIARANATGQRPDLSERTHLHFH